MSQRSIIEINHDRCFISVTESQRFVELLQRAIASGSDEAWEPLKRWGIRRIIQSHHSEDRKVVIGNGVLQREYPFA